MNPEDLIAFQREYNLSPADTARLTPCQVETLRAALISRPASRGERSPDV